MKALHLPALVAEVIEFKSKPSLPRGVIAQSAFGDAAPAIDRGHFPQAILAIGRQDIDPEGLYPSTGLKVLHSSSDHLILDAGTCQLSVGTEVSFQLNYSALVRAMTSPFVTKSMMLEEDRNLP